MNKIQKQVKLFRAKYWKTHNLSVFIGKEVIRTNKSGKQMTECISYDYSLLIAQYLWQACYQILL